MNSAELVNLILAKLRRVKFVAIGSNPEYVSVRFIWGGNDYTALVDSNSYIHVYQVLNYSKIHTERVQGMLNGLVRNDAGELVQP
jgi:hypothetical protein